MDWASITSLLTYIITFIITTDGFRLNDYILDYQPLVYDQANVHKNHERVRRSVSPFLHIKFQAFHKNFNLQLSPASGIFTDNHKLFTADRGLEFVDTHFMYEGQVLGEPKSSVLLFIHNGSIEGHVKMPKNTFHIEPAAKYINSPKIHTIIYPETSLDTDPYRARRAAQKGSCAVDRLKEWMDNASQLKDPEKVIKRQAGLRESVPHSIYSEESNRPKRSVYEEISSRKKRSQPANKMACSLHMRADPLFYEYFLKQKHGTVIDDKQAEDEILAFFASHVAAISTIYNQTVFETYNGEMRNFGLTFVISRSQIMKPADCTSNKINSQYCSNTLDVSNFLDLTSQENHDDFCLVFTFTYRDFTGGTLGLAWVATESSVMSGVCGKYSVFTGGIKKSLNTGIVTIINFGKTIPALVSQLTFAHEVGHNFGSPHDEGSVMCAPYGTNAPNAVDGNYIMFPSATSGTLKNNDNFSPCSKDNMTRIISQVINGRRINCFTASNASFCGNKITEAGEQCDCGFKDECDRVATCCYAKDSPDGPSCQLVSGSECSPQSGPCCGNGCKLVQSADNKTCSEATECAERATCNGANFSCPAANFASKNGEFCSGNTKVCMNGECIGSICSKIGWVECFKTSGDGGVGDDLCSLACKHPNRSECISSSNEQELSKPENEPFKTILLKAKNNTVPLSINLPPGSACDNFRGYCDFFQKCQRIDAQGPFNQLKDMIFNPVTFAKIRVWIEEHWWAVLLICIGIVVFMGIFVKVFSYNTPSENPKRTRARKQNRARVQGLPPAQPRETSYLQSSAPPPYSTGVEMNLSHYDPRYQHGRPNQFDRISAGRK